MWIEVHAIRNEAIIDATTNVEGDPRRRLHPAAPIALLGNLDTRNQFGRTTLFVSMHCGNLGDERPLLEGDAAPDTPIATAARPPTWRRSRPRRKRSQEALRGRRVSKVLRYMTALATLMI